MKATDKSYFSFLQELVRLEEKEEYDEIREEFTRLSPAEREHRGRALLDLELQEKHFSPAEHILATFIRPGHKALPLFSLEAGDVVSLVSGEEEFPTGTVYERSPDSITVAFKEELPEWLEEGQGHYQLHRSVNRSNYKKMLAALDAVLETQNTSLADFRDISLGEKPAAAKNVKLSEIEWQDVSLNSSQKESVRKMLSAKNLALVHGPPGTGKTTALIEIVRQILLRKESVFVTAPSNTACDNVLERLVEKGIQALRLGHPARISNSLREHTLDFRLALHPVGKEISKKAAELERLYKKQNRYHQRRSPRRDAEIELRHEVSFLKQEIKNLKKEVFECVMKESEVIIGTPAGIQDRSIREKVFDWLIFDEATQATEPISWIPIARAKKLVMAGDHFQLPPTVRSREAEEKGLGVSLFERFYDVLEDDSKTLLERQYRMNEKIMGFSSKIFYKNLLVADESVRLQTLAGIPASAAGGRKVKKCPDTEEMLLFIDTAGKGFEERLEEGSESRYNSEEAELVLSELRKMLDLGVPPSEIAVISPYSAQVRLLSSLSPSPAIEIDSVDGFQGREKELVIVSLVRSNMSGEMGFLADTRRMNVAMTRARRKLIVIGDSATLSSIPFYKNFVQYAEEVNGYKSAWEL